jgi:peptidoglycan/LPS O-acetylase OafA/YrhL
MNSRSAHVPIIDAIKALASQLIVWHHLAFYGPMSDVVRPQVPLLMDWLYDQARIAVQAFLVVGGFLAARALSPHPGDARPLYLAPLAWRRYLRLVRPYLVALASALVAAAVARSLSDEPSIPSAPSLGQIVANVLLLQDILGIEALSAGIWYVAIDFQLFVLFACLLWTSRSVARFAGATPAWPTLALCLGSSAISLVWLNRDPSLDIWAPYFFGAYGLGVLAHWIATAKRPARWLPVLAAFVALALAVEYRNRILVAGLTALALAASVTYGWAPRWLSNRVVVGCGRISYAVFLIHYPVLLVVGSVVSASWPQSATANALGLVATWVLSLAAGASLHYTVEVRNCAVNCGHGQRAP